MYDVDNFCTVKTSVRRAGTSCRRARARSRRPRPVAQTPLWPDLDYSVGAYILGYTECSVMEDILEVDQVPVILLSGYGRDEIIARAFEKGASDYVVKPFSPTELVARIQVTLRKQADPDRAEPDQPYVLGDLTIDYEERRVTVTGRRVQLTAKEYQLLYELSVGRGRVLTHDILLRRIWGLYSSGDSRLVRTLVKRLRRTLGDDANDPRYIFTEPGVGYRIDMAEEREDGSSEA